MGNNNIKIQIKRLIDHAGVIAPKIIYFENDKNYGRVTDEGFDFEAFISWKMEAKSILYQLSNYREDLFSDLYKEYLTIEEESKGWHSQSIFVHRVLLLLVGSFPLIDSPLKNNSHIDDNKIINKLYFVKTDKGVVMIDEKTAWIQINQEFEITKRIFSRKINFITDTFKKKIIYRDVAQSYILSKNGFNKPAVIIAGSVIEELLRLFLINKKITVKNNSFNEYIKMCESHRLLKSAISRLSDSVRYFRNLVHLEKEIDSKHTISKATANNAVSSIFIIVNDF